VALNTLLQQYALRVEAALDTRLQHRSIEPRLQDAMRYALFNGGKRVRPGLVYLCNQLLGGDLDAADLPASAIEAVHSYSLVHDDLPAMDDDDLRRGKPTCHIAFDEASAILAGDALQCCAFEWLASPQPMLTAAVQLRMVAILARAAGDRGMVAGQAFDLAHVGQSLSLEQLQQMHRHKTGALLTAAVELGALSAGITGCAALAMPLAWPSRCRTTSSISKATRPPWASPRARTWRRTSQPLRRCSDYRGRGKNCSCCMQRPSTSWRCLDPRLTRCVPWPTTSSSGTTDV